jgi:hypothetical protein
VNADNLVAWYHFEEGPGASTVADLVDTAEFPASNGVILNGGTVADDTSDFDPIFTPGQKVGNVFEARLGVSGLYQNGDATAVACGDPNDKLDDPNTFADGFTLAAWIKPLEDHSGEWGVIMSNGGYDGMFVFFMENGGLHGLLRTEFDHPRGDTADNVLMVNEWNHVAMVWDPYDVAGGDPNSEMTFYVNGDAVPLGGSNAVTLSKQLVDPFPTEVFNIGTPGWNLPDVGAPPFTDLDIVTKPFRGDIDDVRIYNKPLTANEVYGLTFRWCLYDLDGSGCMVDLVDLAAIGAGWQTEYDINDLAILASYWLDNTLFPSY